MRQKFLVLNQRLHVKPLELKAHEIESERLTTVSGCNVIYGAGQLEKSMVLLGALFRVHNFGLIALEQS